MPGIKDTSPSSTGNFHLAMYFTLTKMFSSYSIPIYVIGRCSGANKIGKRNKNPNEKKTIRENVPCIQRRKIPIGWRSFHSSDDINEQEEEEEKKAHPKPNVDRADRMCRQCRKIR